jgi:hypothetical protein
MALFSIAIQTSPELTVHIEKIAKKLLSIGVSPYIGGGF